MMVWKLIDKVAMKWERLYSLWTGQPIPVKEFCSPKSQVAKTMVKLGDPVRSGLGRHAASTENGNENAAAVLALEEAPEGVGKKRQRDISSNEELVKARRMEEGKYLFEDLDGRWWYCADKRNGKAVIRNLTGLYRLLPEEDIPIYLSEGEFRPQEILDVRKDENVLREDEVHESNRVRPAMNFQLLANMAIVNNVEKFEAYMTHKWTLYDRKTVCLDDFTRNGKPLALQKEACLKYREELARALMGVANFERFYRSPLVGQVWADFCPKVEHDFRSPFKHIGCEILTIAIEFEWMKWSREVYKTSGPKWASEANCANELRLRLKALENLFEKGVGEGSKFSQMSFYGEGGMWHRICGRKTGMDTSTKTKPRPSNGEWCMYHIAGQANMKDKEGKDVRCGRRDECNFEHPTVNYSEAKHWCDKNKVKHRVGAEGHK